MGDPLTATGAQSSDGKAAYVQVKLAGNQGESLANESVEAVKTIVERLAPPPGVKVYVTGSAALVADQQQAGDRSLQVIEAVTFTVIIVMLLLVYRSIITSAIMLTMVVLGLLATRGAWLSSVSTGSLGSRPSRPTCSWCWRSRPPPTTPSS
ncbi:transmembrane transport protein MmpL5 [Mycobacterium tuberculosis variant africanum]|nr:transmembrane transport protein MmpL5 [Mycobacterium tuberculosis variant africanum]